MGLFFAGALLKARNIGGWLFTTVPGRIMLFVLYSILLVAISHHVGYGNGVQAQKRDEAKRQQAAIKKVEKIELKGTQIADEIRTDTEKKQTLIEYRTRTITERIPEYVTVQADAGCVIPIGFVSVYNAAVAGSEISTPSGRSFEAPSGVALSTLAATDVDNLGTAHLLRAEVDAWRSWYGRQQTLYDEHASRGRAAAAGRP